MIDYSGCTFQNISIHHVGNKTNGEDLIVSKSKLDSCDKNLTGILSQYFFASFSNPEFYNFTFSNQDFKLNPLYNFAAQIFDSPISFHPQTINIAKHLYELSLHPNIKSGDLFVVHCNNVMVDNMQVELLGIFKSENKQSFLKLDIFSGNFDLNYEQGINIEKLDKGCLIINSNKEEGFKVCIIDKANKADAQYWRDNFLQLRPCSDNYHHTKELLNIAKNFVTQQLSEDFEVSKADQIDLLNRSVAYFKTHETFEKNDFENEVFQDEKVIQSYRAFDKTYREDFGLEVSDSFDISTPAVKKQARIFKSVLKLDKNFHIYIHGDKELIEQGVERDGRKYYKIYFEEET
jgi:hypothetical protein